MPFSYKRFDTLSLYSQREIPAVYDDALSYYEQVMRLLKLVNELIEYVNTIDLTDYALKKDVDALVERTRLALKAYFEETLAADQAEQTVMLKAHAVAKVEGLRRELDERIRNATVGKVTVFDPTAGHEPKPVDVVIRRIFADLQTHALYAYEFDGLPDTAAQMDAIGMTAYEFDIHSRDTLKYKKRPVPRKE